VSSSSPIRLLILFLRSKKFLALSDAIRCEALNMYLTVSNFSLSVKSDHFRRFKSGAELSLQLEKVITLATYF
jgi:hypothetical protein